MPNEYAPKVNGSPWVVPLPECISPPPTINNLDGLA